MAEQPTIIEPTVIEDSVATDIFVVQKPGAVHLLVCEREGDQLLLQVRIVMAPADFERCIADKLERFGGDAPQAAFPDKD